MTESHCYTFLFFTRSSVVLSTFYQYSDCIPKSWKTAVNETPLLFSAHWNKKKKMKAAVVRLKENLLHPLRLSCMSGRVSIWMMCSTRWFKPHFPLFIRWPGRGSVPRPALSQFSSVVIRRSADLMQLKNDVGRISMLENCERVGRDRISSYIWSVAPSWNQPD